MQRFSLLLVLCVIPLGFAAPAFAEIGTCITANGVPVSPWSDAQDPACGADCGAEGVVYEFPPAEFLDVPPEATPCEDEEIGVCTLADQALPPLSALVPSKVAYDPPADQDGPRCLYDGPECQPAAPFPAQLRLAMSDIAPGGHVASASVGRPKPPGRLPAVAGFAAPPTHTPWLAIPESPPPRV
ncbi:MAG: hypothetical protein ACE366_06745 [Bradymonadia bacterium]